MPAGDRIKPVRLHQPRVASGAPSGAREYRRWNEQEECHGGVQRKSNRYKDFYFVCLKKFPQISDRASEI